MNGYVDEFNAAHTGKVSYVYNHGEGFTFFFENDDVPDMTRDLTAMFSLFWKKVDPRFAITSLYGSRSLESSRKRWALLAGLTYEYGNHGPWSFGEESVLIPQDVRLDLQGLLSPSGKTVTCLEHAPTWHNYSLEASIMEPETQTLLQSGTIDSPSFSGTVVPNQHEQESEESDAFQEPKQAKRPYVKFETKVASPLTYCSIHLLFDKTCASGKVIANEVGSGKCQSPANMNRKGSMAKSAIFINHGCREATWHLFPHHSCDYKDGSNVLDFPPGIMGCRELPDTYSVFQTA